MAVSRRGQQSKSKRSPVLDSPPARRSERFAGEVRTAQKTSVRVARKLPVMREQGAVHPYYWAADGMNLLATLQISSRPVGCQSFAVSWMWYLLRGEVRGIYTSFDAMCVSKQFAQSAW